MKQIDEKLDAALKDRRVLLEKILKTPSKVATATTVLVARVRVNVGCCLSIK